MSKSAFAGSLSGFIEIRVRGPLEWKYLSLKWLQKEYLAEKKFTSTNFIKPMQGWKNRINDNEDDNGDEDDDVYVHEWVCVCVYVGGWLCEYLYLI